MQGVSIHTITNKWPVGSRINTLENLITEVKKNFQSFTDYGRKGNIKEKKTIAEIDKWRD